MSYVIRVLLNILLILHKTDYLKFEQSHLASSVETIWGEVENWKSLSEVEQFLTVKKFGKLV